MNSLIFTIIMIGIATQCSIIVGAIMIARSINRFANTFGEFSRLFYLCAKGKVDDIVMRDMI